MLLSVPCHQVLGSAFESKLRHASVLALTSSIAALFARTLEHSRGTFFKLASLVRVRTTSHPAPRRLANTAHRLAWPRCAHPSSSGAPVGSIQCPSGAGRLRHACACHRGCHQRHPQRPSRQRTSGIRTQGLRSSRSTMRTACVRPACCSRPPASSAWTASGSQGAPAPAPRCCSSPSAPTPPNASS